MADQEQKCPGCLAPLTSSDRSRCSGCEEQERITVEIDAQIEQERSDREYEDGRAERERRAALSDEERSAEDEALRRHQDQIADYGFDQPWELNS